MKHRKDLTIIVLAAVFAAIGGVKPLSADEPAAEGETPVSDEWAVIVDESRPEGLHAYDVGDYVQDGFVGHFDAIRNAGADLPHDANATTWKNLVAGVPDAAIVQRPGDASRWTDDGFCFAGRARAYVDEPGIALGSQLTIQCAVDVDYRDQEPGVWPYLFGGLKDFGLFMGQGSEGTPSRAIIFKTDPYIGNAFCRAQGNWTEGRYLTAMFDENRNQYVFWGTDPSGGYSGQSPNPLNVPAVRWGIGGSPRDDYREDGTLKNPLESIRHLKGTYHSLRLYNRALTIPELEHNRRIDDIRFRGAACSVILQSATAGAEGTEANGQYDVNGIHEFTRPASVAAGEAVYVPAGYQLEVWDNEKNAWGVPEILPDASFTYTNCLARARVRVTWLWEIAGGKLKLDATAYAPLGLVGNYDGIRNVGADLPHDSSATIWKNLAGVNDAAILKRDGDDVSAWSADGFNFANQCRAQTLLRMPPFGDQATFQFAGDFDYREQRSVDVWPYIFCAEEDFGLFGEMVSASGLQKQMYFKADPYVGGERVRITHWNWMGSNYFTAMLSGGKRAHLFTGTNPGGEVVSEYTNDMNIKSSIWAWSGSSRDGSMNQEIRHYKGFFRSARFYNRALSRAELEYNRMIDDARFRGLQSVASTGLVQIVGSAAKNFSADDTVYWLKSGSLTVSAPSSVTCGGADYTCVGYRIETVNPVYAFFETTETGTDTTYTFAADETKNRRITWLWRANRLRGGAEYDVDDYVQEGLVGHFDAIRNIASDLPHSPTSFTWKNLVRGMADADIVKRDGDASDWTDGGYYFAGQTRAYVDSPGIALGTKTTIQCVVDVDYREQAVPDAWAYLFGDVKDFGIFFGNGTAANPSKFISFKTDPYTGSAWQRAEGNWTEGRHLTAIFDENQDQYVFWGTNPSEGYFKHSPNPLSVPACRWGFGGSPRDDYNENGSLKNPLQTIRFLKGTYHSLRLYNRALTQAELAHNRMIDDVRFHGAVVTNVVVASSHEEAHGVETNGVYAVDGSWTFTAEPMALESGKTVRPSGYTLETLTPSGWGNRTSSSATSYTWTEGYAPVRLTWRYANGMTFLIR